MTWITAALVAAGAVFGGLNTLYAAFSSRIREMATLQAVGFKRPALLLSLLQESLLATMLGTLLAAAFVLWFADGITVPFSIGTFVIDISPSVLGIGLVGQAFASGEQTFHDLESALELVVGALEGGLWIETELAGQIGGRQ